MLRILNYLVEIDEKLKRSSCCLPGVYLYKNPTFEHRSQTKEFTFTGLKWTSNFTETSSSRNLLMAKNWVVRFVVTVNRWFQLTRNLRQARQEGGRKQIHILGLLLINVVFHISSLIVILFLILIGTSSHPCAVVNKFHTSIQVNISSWSWVIPFFIFDVNKFTSFCFR